MRMEEEAATVIVVLPTPGPEILLGKLVFRIAPRFSGRRLLK